MPISEIEEFAENLVSKVRDAAIRSLDSQLQANSMSPVAKRWRKAISDSDTESAIRLVIPDVVDGTVAFFLLALDQEILRLSFITASGKTVDLTSEGLGELCGWYMGGGWRALYSKERFFDDFADLA